MSERNTGIDDLLPWYILGTLDSEEQQRVEAYLREDPTAMEYVAQMRPVATFLTLSAEPAAVSSNVKKELFGRIISQPPAPESSSRWLSLKEKLRFAVRSQPMLVVLSLTIAVLSLAWGLVLSARVSVLRNEVSSLQAALANQQRVILHLSDPGSKSIAIAGTELQPEASGRFIFNPGSREGGVIITGLQPLPGDRVYQLWLIKGDVPESAGTFTVDQDGRASILVKAPASISSYDIIGVSVEPVGGSLQPTGEIVVLSPLSPDA